MESCRYQTGAKYYCSLDCIALFFRWILVYSVFCLSSIALVLMYCDSYFWKSWSWSWHYYQGNVNSLLLTASQNHSFTLLHNYLVINLIEVKKKKNPSDQTVVWPQDFSSIKMEDVWFLKQQIASKFLLLSYESYLL